MELMSFVQESWYSIRKLILKRLAFLASNGTQLSHIIANSLLNIMSDTLICVFNITFPGFIKSFYTGLLLLGLS